MELAFEAVSLLRMVELLGESRGGPSNLRATLSLLSQYKSAQDLATTPMKGSPQA